METNCKTCHTKGSKGGKKYFKNGTSFFTTLLLIIAPKCPLCLMAYGGSILLFFDIEAGSLFPYVVHFKPVIGGLVLATIAYNYKGKRTLQALVFGGIIYSLLLAQTYWYQEWVPTWVVYLGFLFAAWYNGNLQHVIRFLQSTFSKLKLTGSSVLEKTS